ncbi:MAG: hypothetical protein JW821_09820 [Deltaproteobacteria bacterium]|nr:hypothetical protein [Deltaproteobacteria bacterium]
MTPLSFEWQWNIDYIIFMGLLYLALGVVGCGLIVAYIKAWMDVDLGEEGKEGEGMSSRSKYSDY